jgi:hypothetical protein
VCCASLEAVARQLQCCIVTCVGCTARNKPYFVSRVDCVQGCRLLSHADHPTVLHAWRFSAMKRPLCCMYAPCLLLHIHQAAVLHVAYSSFEMLEKGGGCGWVIDQWHCGDCHGCICCIIFNAVCLCEAIPRPLYFRFRAVGMLAGLQRAVVITQAVV